MKARSFFFLTTSLILILCGYVQKATAQPPVPEQNKKAMVLRIGEFKWLDPVKPSEDKIAELTEIVKAKVAEAATTSKRFEVLDDEITEDVNQYVQNEAFMDLPAEKLREIITGAMNDHLLVGEITKCKFTKRTTGAKGYTCVLTLKLTVANAYNKGEIISSRSFVSNFKDLIVKNTSEAAMDDALQSITGKMVDYFSNNFAVYGSILKYDKNNVIISCGKEQGVKPGDLFQVGNITLSKGTAPQHVHVGKIKVKDVLADGTSVCSISEGEEGIIERFNNASRNSWLQCKLILK